MLLGCSTKIRKNDYIGFTYHLRRKNMVKEVVVIENTHANIWHLVAGVIMALLGVFIWFNPAQTLLALALYIGIVFMVVGVGYFVASFSVRSGWYLSVGILDMLIGFILLANLGVTVVSLPIIFALWCLAVGVAQVAAAWQLQREGRIWGWSLAAGLLGIAFGFILLAYPVLSAAIIIALMGIYFLAYGIVEILEYFYARRLAA